MTATPNVLKDERTRLVQRLTRELDVPAARIERALDHLIARRLVEVRTVAASLTT